MAFLSEKCTFAPVTDELLTRLQSFSCHHEEDLAIFFRDKATFASKQLMSQSYCFYDPATMHMVAAFCVLNTNLAMEHLPNYVRRSINKEVVYEKQRRQYPATLIGQLAVFDGYEQYHIGNELMDFILVWLMEHSMNMGNRFLLVDAINHEKVLEFYNRNDFKMMFRTEEDEKSAIGKPLDEPLSTRMMFYDMIHLFEN